MLLLMLVSLVITSGCASVPNNGKYDLSDSELEKVERLRMMLDGGKIAESDVLPEEVVATVRDIIDGDTIDVDIVAMSLAGDEIRLPEYKETGHARVRFLGIISPDRSPKGEILCSDVDIYEVDGEFADASRKALLYLNDKEVILRIDPDNSWDSHERILAAVEHDGENICLEQIKNGMACGYYRGENKYVDTELYAAETLSAQGLGKGMWGSPTSIRINIYSQPSNARLFIDGVATRHNTPSDEEELDEFLTPGWHVFRAEKSGMSGETVFEIISGNNDVVMIILEEPPSEEPEVEPVAEEEPVQENVTVPETREYNITITEIMYDSLSVYDQHGEFIEIRNDGECGIDISGWKISDNDKTDELVPTNDTLLGPGDLALIVGNSFDVNVTGTIFMTGHSVICSYGLKNSGENVSLITPNGTISYTIDYGEYETCDPGHSIVRTGTGWNCSLTENGTPGY